MVTATYRHLNNGSTEKLQIDQWPEVGKENACRIHPSDTPRRRRLRARSACMPPLALDQQGKVHFWPAIA